MRLDTAWSSKSQGRLSLTLNSIVGQACDEEKLLGHLGVVLYEYLGEEYPEVLGSILGALKSIVNVIGMTKMTPPIKDLLPRLTPILKNRHEKVQENCIDLVGRIADRGAEFVPAREWMRICFELLEMLKAHKKGIRRATVNTFGYIAKAIGPQDVLVTLLNNLKVQERQNRVCTTVAIAIVAETCSPFTVLPALMNEYKVGIGLCTKHLVVSYRTDCTSQISGTVLGHCHGSPQVVIDFAAIKLAPLSLAYFCIACVICIVFGRIQSHGQAGLLVLAHGLCTYIHASGLAKCNSSSFTTEQGSAFNSMCIFPRASR